MFLENNSVKHTEARKKIEIIFVDTILKCILPLLFICKGSINNKSTSVQVMALHQTGNKPLSELMFSRIENTQSTSYN